MLLVDDVDGLRQVHGLAVIDQQRTITVRRDEILRGVKAGKGIRHPGEMHRSGQLQRNGKIVRRCQVQLAEISAGDLPREHRLQGEVPLLGRQAAHCTANGIFGESAPLRRQCAGPRAIPVLAEFPLLRVVRARLARSSDRLEVRGILSENQRIASHIARRKRRERCGRVRGIQPKVRRLAVRGVCRHISDRVIELPRRETRVRARAAIQHAKMRIDAHVGQQRNDEVRLVLAIAITVRQNSARRARPNALNAKLDRDVAQRRDKIESLLDFIDASLGRRGELLRHRLHRVGLIVRARGQTPVPRRELVPRIERADIERSHQVLHRRVEGQRLERGQIWQLPCDRAHAVGLGVGGGGVEIAQLEVKM